MVFFYSFCPYVVTSFIIVAIAVVFILFFLLSSFFYVLLISTAIIIFFFFRVTVFFYCFVLPLDRRNNLGHRSIHSPNIFVYFFFALKVFYNKIDIHLHCCCFQYEIKIANCFFFNNILFKLLLSFLQVVVLINDSDILFLLIESTTNVD